MPKFHLEKIVRNGIPEHQISMGQIPTYRKLSPEEHRKALIAKIIEEAGELGKSASEDRAKELADVQQALDDLAALEGVDKGEIGRAQEKRAEQMGTFSEGLYISVLEMSEDDPWTAYYRKETDRFPEE